MTTSNYAPDVKVEIAWNAGFNTPAADRVWTDVSEWVELAEGITITCGRGDERSTADANQLTLTLDNSDGQFTAARPGSPYYPNVKLDRPIRVSALSVDGLDWLVRFVGFVNEWPVEWDGTDAYASATISASSRLSRLGLVANLRSIVETAILANSPAAYYTLGEAAGATQANDSSGNRADALTLAGDPTLPVVFGNATGPGTDSLTAAEFADGQNLSGQIALTGGGALTVEAFFLVSTNAQAFLQIFDTSGAPAAILYEQSTSLNATDASGPIGTGADTYALGATAHAALTVSGTTWTLYLDGVSLATGTRAAIPSGLYTLVVGPQASTVSHVAIWDSVLTAAQIAAHAHAGLTGYAGETTSERLVRYAGYAGVPPAEVVAETGQTTVAHIDTTDKQVVELMRIMETTEGGVLFDDRDGTLALHNRAHRLTAPPIYTLDFLQHQIESGYAPKLDRTGLANDVTAQNVAGTVTAHQFDDDSKTDYGVATLSIQTASEDDDEPLFLASWELYKYKEPLVRVPNLSVDALAQVDKAPSCAAIMATTLGDKIAVVNHPSQASLPNAAYFVEGWTEVYGQESLRFTFNLSPTSPEDQTLIVGDPVRGAWGVNPFPL